MGMNLYTLKGVHIGKRSAVGIWCWDCKVDLNPKVDIFGEIRKGNEIPMERVCPSCGKKAIAGKTKYNPACRELGFNKDDPKSHRGIDGASGFCWQIGECGLGGSVDQIKKKLKKLKFVDTEYGERWPIKKFWDMFLDVIVEDYEHRDFS